MLFWCLAVRWLRLYSTSTAEGDVLLLVREQDSQPKNKSQFHLFIYDISNVFAELHSSFWTLK